MHFLRLVVPAVLSSALVTAHPGHDIKREIEELEKAHEYTRRDISHCYSKLKARGIHQQTANRRAEILKAEREKRGITAEPSQLKLRELPQILDARDAGTVLNTSHLSSVTYSPSDGYGTVFTGNQSCILVPEVTEGPYYVSGEYIRSDVRETKIQSGIDLIIDIQVIDVSTCEAVPNVYVDFWHANATGVYSGVADASRPTNINATFGRGLQATGPEGAVQFTTFYPGHYQGRTNHIHVATHVGGTAFPNGTFLGTTVSHVGQLFFDTNLTTVLERNTPYTLNTAPVTTNTQDGIFRQEAALGDPVVEYSLLGSSITQGLFGWIAFGIDPSNSKAISAAATLTSGGGVSNGGGGGGFPGGPPPNGTFPGGPRPNGTFPGGPRPTSSTSSSTVVV
ncbi:extracellular dioxygenase protein [Rutstroemia sp. NJR-2017a WRK4]|nr:extracellular dioxygenase protein [Rutstroemia sp. NJR-2017a WRK4]